VLQEQASESAASDLMFLLLSMHSMTPMCTAADYELVTNNQRSINGSPAGVMIRVKEVFGNFQQLRQH
jgi:hypothetical protein